MTGPFLQIGKIRKSHGLKGELRIFIEAEYLKDFQKAKLLFLGTPDNNIPYFISSLRSAPNLLIKLEEVDTKEQADALGKAYILLPEAELSINEAPEEEEAGLEQLVGYQLYDRDSLIAEIIRIDSYPQQEMIVCIIDGKEKLIPFHEALIESINAKNRRLIMHIPEGLLDLQ